MARTALPRFRADVTLTVELAAVDEDDAARQLEELADLMQARAATAVRNAGGRTARVLTDHRYLGEPSAV